MWLYALHTIHRKPPGKSIQIVNAKSVFNSADEAEVDDLKARNAVRDATDDEVELAKVAYTRANGGNSDGFEDSSAPVKKAPKPVKAAEDDI